MQLPWCEALVARFQTDTGIVVNITLKDAADALAQVAAEKAIPKHDVWYSGTGDPHLRAAEMGLIDEYRSALLPQLHDWALRQAEQAKERTVGVTPARSASATTARRWRTSTCRSRAAGPTSPGPSTRRAALGESVRVGDGYPTLATLVQVFGEERAFELMKAIHRNAGNYAHGDRCDTRRRARRDDDRRRDAA